MHLSMVLAISLLVDATAGLRCWNCIGRSPEDCANSGRSEYCQVDQSMLCATEIRYHNEGRVMIYKRCKQANACRNNARQNPTQCHGEQSNSVCRCCCAKDNCNKTNLSCKTIAGRSAYRCRGQPSPTNGMKKCHFVFGRNNVGSKCTFHCDKGYKLVGSRISMCKLESGSQKPKFDSAVPKCEATNENGTSLTTTRDPESATTATTPGIRTACSNLPPFPRGGGRSCLNIGDGVVCSYFCPRGLPIIGDETLTCTRKDGWLGRTPQCGHQCDILPPSPSNGAKECSGVRRAGANCHFSCDPGFLLIGSEILLCSEISGVYQWSGEPPICRADVPR